MGILDCDWRFRFRCPKQWENLDSTDDPNIRQCEVCQRTVHLCHSHEDVHRQVTLGNCVAIGFSTQTDTEEELVGFVGEVCDDDEAFTKHGTGWSKRLSLLLLLAFVVEAISLIFVMRWIHPIIGLIVCPLVMWLYKRFRSTGPMSLQPIDILIMLGNVCLFGIAFVQFTMRWMENA